MYVHTCRCVHVPHSMCMQDNLAAFQKVSSMYIKYVLAFRKLEECYDQIVHPQKRRLLRHMLDGTIGRYTAVCLYMYIVHKAL